MAWSYMVICLFDFIIAPTGTAILITLYKSSLPVWTSLTLSNGGIMHIAFGAILGVSAWGRTKESVVGMQGGYGQGGVVIASSESETMQPARAKRPWDNDKDKDKDSEPDPEPKRDPQQDVTIPKPKKPVVNN